SDLGIVFEEPKLARPEGNGLKLHVPARDVNVEDARKALLRPRQNRLPGSEYERTLEHALAVNGIHLTADHQLRALAPRRHVDNGKSWPVSKDGEIPGEYPTRARAQHGVFSAGAPERESWLPRPLRVLLVPASRTMQISLADIPRVSISCFR